MKNVRREKIKGGKVIYEAGGQEFILRRLDSEMSRGEEMDRVKRKWWERTNSPALTKKSRSCFLMSLPPTLDTVHIS